MITRLLDADVDQYNEELIAEARDLILQEKHPLLYVLFTLWRRMRYGFRHEINTHIICPILGHDTATSTFFTESEGVQAWWCKRCGTSGHYKFY